MSAPLFGSCSGRAPGSGRRRRFERRRGTEDPGRGRSGAPGSRPVLLRAPATAGCSRKSRSRTARQCAQRGRRVGRRHGADLGVEGRDPASPVGEAQPVRRRAVARGPVARTRVARTPVGHRDPRRIEPSTTHRPMTMSVIGQSWLQLIAAAPGPGSDPRRTRGPGRGRPCRTGPMRSDRRRGRRALGLGHRRDGRDRRGAESVGGRRRRGGQIGVVRLGGRAGGGRRRPRPGRIRRRSARSAPACASSERDSDRSSGHSLAPRGRGRTIVAPAA